MVKYGSCSFKGAEVMTTSSKSGTNYENVVRSTRTWYVLRERGTFYSLLHPGKKSPWLGGKGSRIGVTGSGSGVKGEGAGISGKVLRS